MPVLNHDKKIKKIQCKNKCASVYNVFFTLKENSKHKLKTLYINLINKLRIIYNKKCKRKFIMITKNKIENLRDKYVFRYMISQYRQ